jgi:hypothetical protein
VLLGDSEEPELVRCQRPEILLADQLKMAERRLEENGRRRQRRRKRFVDNRFVEPQYHALTMGQSRPAGHPRLRFSGIADSD